MKHAKTFFDLSSWGPGFWDSGNLGPKDWLMQPAPRTPPHPMDESLPEALIKFKKTVHSDYKKVVWGF